MRAISVSDIKSIIAFSTISQISHMFFILVIPPILRLFHIVIHALFKSLLPLLAGSPILVQANSQAVYRMKINQWFIKIIYLSSSSLLILSISKEVIIHSIEILLIPSFMFMISLLGSVFTTIYSFKIYISIFYYFISTYSGYLSFILPFLTISSLLIDEIFPVVYYQGSFSLFFTASFIMIDSLFSIATIIISLLFITFLTIYLYYILFIYYSYLIYIPLHSTTSYTIPIIQDFFILFSSYIIKGPINLIEVFTGLNSVFSILHIHYFPYIQLVVPFCII